MREPSAAAESDPWDTQALKAAQAAPPGRRVLLLSPHPSSLPTGGGERYAVEVAKSLNRYTPYKADFASAEDFSGDFGPYDLVQIPTPDLPLTKRARRAGKPVVISFLAGPRSMARHGFETGRRGVFRIGQALVYGWDIWRTNRALRRADLAVCMSECTLADVVWQARRMAPKTHLCEVGVDTEWWNEGSGRDGGYVLFVGRLVKSKGVDLVVDAATRLGLPCKIAGSGSLEAELKRRAGPNVEFLGDVRDDARLRRLYQEASLAVFPSTAEGYGLVGLEALACGAPTAVSTAFCIRGPAEKLAHWFPPNDPAAVEAAIRALWGTKTPAGARRTAQTVRDHHSTRRGALELAALYDRLLDRAPRARVAVAPGGRTP